VNEIFRGDKVREAVRDADVAVAAYSADTQQPYHSRAEHRERQDAYARGLAAEQDRWSEHQGALGDKFEPGVYDPDGVLSEEERAAAEQLAETDGAAVHVRAPELGVLGAAGGGEGVAMVRRSESDEGTATVFVAVDQATPQAVEDAVNRAADRMGTEAGAGEAVLDGRLAGLDQEVVQAGCDAALVHGVRMPERVHCVLAEDRVYTWP
jgi:hypothetical protein